MLQLSCLVELLLVKEMVDFNAFIRGGIGDGQDSSGRSHTESGEKDGAEPTKTADPSRERWTISLGWPMFPVLSLIPRMLGCSELATPGPIAPGTERY